MGLSVPNMLSWVSVVYKRIYEVRHPVQQSGHHLGVNPILGVGWAHIPFWGGYVKSLLLCFCSTWEAASGS